MFCIQGEKKALADKARREERGRGAEFVYCMYRRMKQASLALFTLGNVTRGLGG